MHLTDPWNTILASGELCRWASMALNDIETARVKTVVGEFIERHPPPPHRFSTAYGHLGISQWPQDLIVSRSH